MAARRGRDALLMAARRCSPPAPPDAAESGGPRLNGGLSVLAVGAARRCLARSMSCGPVGAAAPACRPTGCGARGGSAELSTISEPAAGRICASLASGHMRSDAQDRLNALIGRMRPPARPPASPPARPPDAPPSARLRATPDRSHVRTLVLIGVVAALVAAGYLWLARPRPQTSAAPMASATLTGPPPADARPAVSASPAAAASVVVHVLGKVKHPGVITLPSGSRVAEAIKAAGGVRAGAKTGTLNLARKVVDGEQIPVGVPRPTPPPAPAASPGASGPSGAPLDLNTATADQLDDLPGVGPVLAQRIVAYRTQHDGFRSVEQLQEVSGIGAHRFADLKPLVRV